jgi:hypothetical protein
MSDTSVNERFDRIDKSIDRLTQYVIDLREETTSRLQVIDSRLDFLSSTVASIDVRLPALTKATLEAGSLARLQPAAAMIGRPTRSPHTVSGGARPTPLLPSMRLTIRRTASLRYRLPPGPDLS